MKELLQQKAEAHADSIERRGCAYWSGLNQGFLAGAKEILDNPELYFRDESNEEISATNKFKLYLNSIINKIPDDIHEELWSNLFNCIADKIRQGKENKELKEKVTELEGVIAKLSQKVILYESNY